MKLKEGIKKIKDFEMFKHRFYDYIGGNYMRSDTIRTKIKEIEELIGGKR